MNDLFRFHKLNTLGQERARRIAELFDSMTLELGILCPEGRSFSIAKTKLEEACFFAKKAMASSPANGEEV